jgi:effector-binding domain-containing protein
MSNNSVVPIHVPDQLVASITYSGYYNEAKKYLDQLYKAVNTNIDGKPFTLFHGKNPITNTVTVEICMPIRKHVNYYDIKTKVLKGGRAFSLLHIGPHNTMTESYNRLILFMKEIGIEDSLVIREHYHKGPGMFFKGNPDKYRTELIVVL